MLEVSLQHRLGGFTLDAEFTAPAGITVLFGRSGSGKTSIVNSIAGLQQPTQARVILNGDTLSDTTNGIHKPTHARRLGYIFQEGRLFEHLSVRDNLRYGQRFNPAGRLGLADIVELLGIGDLQHRNIRTLSGGEKQRVAIGRALLSQPRMLLADEPLAALDKERKAELLPYFKHLNDSLGIPVLYVTHATDEVLQLATTVIVMDDGKVARQGEPSLVFAQPSAAFEDSRDIGSVLDATVDQHHDDGLTELQVGAGRLLVPETASTTGTQVRVRIAAQDVLLARSRPQGLSALNVLSGTIEKLEPHSSSSVIVHLASPVGPLVARITRRSLQNLGLEQGTNVFAIIKTVALEA
ncbi:MAG: molybdenum ABC transporter ATP-binding protein [Pseudomonadota bacterium]